MAKNIFEYNYGSFGDRIMENNSYPDGHPCKTCVLATKGFIMDVDQTSCPCSKLDNWQKSQKE